jgi:hypothetical protein
MFHLVPDRLLPFACIAFGLVLIFWPPPKRAEQEMRRQARLRELQGGAEEQYLEERRELESYGPNSAGPYRLWGALMLAVGIALFFL